MINRKDTYNEVIVPQLMKDLGVKNKLALPRLKKVVVNVGIGVDVSVIVGVLVIVAVKVGVSSGIVTIGR